MKTKNLLSIMAMALMVSAFGQNFELTFTAIDSTTNVQLDSVKVINRTAGGDTVLYWPDTVLTLYHVGIFDKFDENSNFQIQQNYPNPVFDQTTVNFCIPEKGDVKLTITDVLGRQVINAKQQLQKGCHEFSFKPGNSEIYFFTVTLNNKSRSIKILNAGIGGDCSLDYLGSSDTRLQTKSKATIQGFSFTLGDILLYIAYYDTIESGMQDSPETSNEYTFQFAADIPCLGTPTIDYGGQIYNTVQIYSQCWMKENLNVGTRINSSIMPTDNDTIEKYCFADHDYYCNGVWGGLYFWNELMAYTYENGGQGICPEGWHIPDDLDWQILEGAADSEYGIESPKWGNMNWRGSDVGGNLKQTGTISWTPPNTGATNAFGFTALPAGYFVQGDFWGLAYKGMFWSSDVSHKYFRNMDWNQTKVKKGDADGDEIAISVRCVKDN